MRIGNARSGKYEWEEQLTVMPWYDGEWDIYLEPVDEALAEKAAQWTEKLCLSGLFGYSEESRWSGYYSIRTSNGELPASKAFFDCSSMIISAYIFAGLEIDPVGYTGNMEKIFSSTGLFTAKKDYKYLKDCEYGKRGGIWILSGEHTVICLDNGAKAEKFSEEEIRKAKIRYRSYLKSRKHRLSHVTGAAAGLIRNSDKDRFRFAGEGIINAFDEVTDNSHADKILRYGLAGDELIEIDSKVSYIPLDEIPDKVKETFVAYEDVRFYNHKGYDLRGIIRSLVNNIRGRHVQGASTITMQLVKMLFLYQYRRKIKYKLSQLYLAVLLERHYSKDEILELYINTLYFSNRIYGFDMASRFYFNKSPKELSLSECVYLAVISQRPNRLNPLRSPELTESYRQKRLKYFYKRNLITEEEFNESIKEVPVVCCKKKDGSDPSVHYKEIYSFEFDRTLGRFSQNVQKVYDRLCEAGFAKSVIAGIMGNLYVESYIRPDAGISFGNPGAVGIVQWNGERKSDLQESMPDTWMELDAQIDYLLSELREDGGFCSLVKEDDQQTVEYYSDLFQAVVVRNIHVDTIEESGSGISNEAGPFAGRISHVPNQYDGKYYLDADRRRNYSRIISLCIQKMEE